MKNKIAVVIVTHNRKELLRGCLQAVAGQTLPPDAIIIVDNGSTDGTREMLVSEKYICPPENETNGFLCSKNEFHIPASRTLEITYLYSNANLGGAGGFKKGIEFAHQSGYGWIWIMDDDVDPLPCALENLARQRKLGPGIGFLASRVTGLDRKISMNLPEIDTRPNKNGYPDWEKYLEQGIIKIKRATFVSILLNSAVIDSAGLPRASFFIWGDDTEYTLRITQKFKFSAYLIGDSLVIHRRENQRNISIRQEGNRTKIGLYYYFYRNHYIITQKYYLNRDLLFYMIDSGYLLLQLLTSRDQHKTLKFKTILKGLWDGFLFKG